MSATVVNLVGGPGCGKSTTAAGLFFLMKCAGIKCELVTEYAKELVYDEAWAVLERQIAVVSEQEARQRRVVDKVNFIITDAPLLTHLAYVRDPRDRKAVEVSARSLFDSYDNINFGLLRVKPYMRYGRNQTEQEARAIDHTLIQDIWKDEVIEAFVPGDEKAPQEIFDFMRAQILI